MLIHRTTQYATLFLLIPSNCVGAVTPVPNFPRNHEGSQKKCCYWQKAHEGHKSQQETFGQNIARFADNFHFFLPYLSSRHHLRFLRRLDKLPFFQLVPSKWVCHNLQDVLFQMPAFWAHFKFSTKLCHLTSLISLKKLFRLNSSTETYFQLFHKWYRYVEIHDSSWN